MVNLFLGLYILIYNPIFFTIFVSYNSSLINENGELFRYAYQDGKRGLWVKEADTDVFVPFSSSQLIFYEFQVMTDYGYGTFSAPSDGTVIITDTNGQGRVTMSIDGVTIGGTDPYPRIIISSVKSGQTVFVNGWASGGARYCFFIPD